MQPLKFCVPCLSMLLLMPSLPAAAIPVQPTPTYIRSQKLPPHSLAINLSQFQPRLRLRLPSRGVPGSRIGGATRGDCVAGQQTLTALLPPTNLGLTISQQPTIYLYIPQTTAKTGELVVLDQNQNPLATIQLAIPETAGVVGVRFPAELAKTLKPGQTYQWSFSLLCHLDDPSSFITVEGGIERIEPNPILMNQLQKAELRDRLYLYAEAGLWYETLATLAELRRSHPQDVNLSQEWSALLVSVGLDAVAAAPLASNP